MAAISAAGASVVLRLTEIIDFRRHTDAPKITELVSDVLKGNGCCTRVPPHCFEVHMEPIMGF
jgi:hypothetical protein